MTVSTTLTALLARIKAPPGLPRPGLFHYTHAGTEERSRIHLRIDADHSGLLLVNANRVIHLNPTAAFMAYLVLEQVGQAEALRAIRRAYSVPAAQAQQDYAQVRQQVEQLIRPDGACPVCELDVEITAPFTARPSAPYRMDLAVTYRCNNDCPHCYNARPRTYPELPTEAWLRILDRLWEIGIPHVVFTGGEATLRDDLPELIAHAERNGQITGLNTNARRLADRAYVQKLVEAGLDHVQITVESHDADVHDRMVNLRGAWKQTLQGVRNVLDTPLYVMTNTTMLQENSPTLRQTLDFLAETGVPTIGLNALIYAGRGATVGTGLPEADLPPLLELARERTDFYGQRLIWYTPTQYCHFDPMQLELGVKGCTAALYNMCIEPDGKVIPCQSYYAPLGTLPDDPWEAIWNHPLSISLRERRYVPAKCTGCSLLAECGGGCPLLGAA
jgi:radical SAM protein with 4Fe4S-binding SPASM domain